jgi:hypothetical protein
MYLSFGSTTVSRWGAKPTYMNSSRKRIGILNWNCRALSANGPARNRHGRPRRHALLLLRASHARPITLPVAIEPDLESPAGEHILDPLPGIGGMLAQSDPLARQPFFFRLHPPHCSLTRFILLLLN